MATQATERRITRARDDAFLGGVCAGLAEYLEFDAIVVRILAVLITCLTCGLGAIVYAVLWLRIPLESDSKDPYDVRPESAESRSFGCVDCTVREEPFIGIPLYARLAVAAGLMVLFLIVATGIAPLIPGTQWWQFWPLCLLMTGLCLIIIPIRSSHEAVWHAAGIVLTSVSASILPMTLGVLSWGTAEFAFVRLWPLMLAAVALFIVGMMRTHDALILGAAFCVVLFCVVGVSICAVPGDIDALLVYIPTGQSVQILFSS